MSVTEVLFALAAAATIASLGLDVWDRLARWREKHKHTKRMTPKEVAKK